MELHVDNLVVEYAAGDYVVRPVDGLSFSAESGALVVLLGPSGCGKTTLLSCLAGILSPTSGRISFGDIDVCALDRKALMAYRRETVGVVFQAFNLVPSLNALENVAAPLLGAGVSGRQARARAAALLDHVGLGDRLSYRPGQLSGGQQQRVAVARALGHEPALLLADEPTAHLDYVQVETVLRLLRDLASPGRVVVVATHDERLLPLADLVIEMVDRPQEDAGEPVHRSFARGEVIFKQGTRGDRIFVVESGEIAIERSRPDGGTDVLALIGPGEHFGEMGPLFGLPRSATARARRTSVVVDYSVKQFAEVIGLERIGNLIGKSAATPRRPRPRQAVRR